MTVLAYITDLFFEAKVSQTAQAVGAKLKVVSSIYKFLPELEDKPSLLLIDLNAEGISPTSLIAQIRLKHPDLPIIAYARKGQEELMERSEASGASQVLTRSAFFKDLEKILSKLPAE